MIWCGIMDTGGQGAEIMEAADADEFVFVGAQDAFHEREFCTVAELHSLETQILDLFEHFLAVIVAVGIPACGKGKHGQYR